jgi:hypothetical protein
LSFYDRVRNYNEKASPQDCLLELIKNLDRDKVELGLYLKDSRVRKMLVG